MILIPQLLDDPQRFPKLQQGSTTFEALQLQLQLRKMPQYLQIYTMIWDFLDVCRFWLPLNILSD